jgi:hypothetical protein
MDKIDKINRNKKYQKITKNKIIKKNRIKWVKNKIKKIKKNQKNFKSKI